MPRRVLEAQISELNCTFGLQWHTCLLRVYLGGLFDNREDCCSCGLCFRNRWHLRYGNAGADRADKHNVARRENSLFVQTVHNCELRRDVKNKSDIHKSHRLGIAKEKARKVCSLDVGLVWCFQQGSIPLKDELHIFTTKRYDGTVVHDQIIQQCCCQLTRHIHVFLIEL